MYIKLPAQKSPIFMNKKHLNILLVRECANLMYHEGVTQYFEAKKIAAKRICKKGNQHFPSNADISEAVYQLSLQDTQFDRDLRLFKMRLKALEVMELLDTFSPHLIGSVSTGKIKRTSDIDIHVFCDDIELLRTFLDDSNILFEQQEVMIMRNNRPTLYQHIYITNEFAIELSVYPVNDLRVSTRSSTDGKPIKRLNKRKLVSLLEDEHWDLLCKYE